MPAQDHDEPSRGAHITLVLGLTVGSNVLNLGGVPINPLGVVGTYVGGWSPEGAVQSALIGMFSDKLLQEGEFVLSELLGRGDFTPVGPRGPDSFDPSYDASVFGGFINGVRLFLRHLVG